MAGEAGLSTVAGVVSGVDPSSMAMRVRLEEPDDVSDIIVFLGSCDCRARQVSNDIIDVGFVAETQIQRSLDLVAAGRCYRCAAVVGEALAELGSPLCQDCRDSGRGEGLDRLRIEAYLRIWNVLHPAARASILDESTVLTG
jgi:hypothetical protein